MVALLLYYTLMLTLWVGLCVFAYRRLRGYGHWLALPATAICAIGALLLWPIPIHGGFTLVGTQVYREWSNEREQARQIQQQQQITLAKSASRFAGALPYQLERTLADGWQIVSLQDGASAWLDENSGMIWSPWIALPRSANRPTLDSAKARCEQYHPAGYWALATTAEAALMWHAHGERHLPAATTSWMEYFTQPEFDLELASYHLQSNSNNENPARGDEVFSVRCVARSEAAPDHGYRQWDVGLEIWNRYQLQRIR